MGGSIFCPECCGQTVYVCFETRTDDFCAALNGLALRATKPANGTSWTASGANSADGTIAVTITNNNGYAITWTCDGGATQDTVTFPAGESLPLTATTTATSACCAGRSVTVTLSDKPISCPPVTPPNPCPACDQNTAPQQIQVQIAGVTQIPTPPGFPPYCSDCLSINGTYLLAPHPSSPCAWLSPQKTLCFHAGEPGVSPDAYYLLTITAGLSLPNAGLFTLTVKIVLLPVNTPTPFNPNLTFPYEVPNLVAPADCLTFNLDVPRAFSGSSAQSQYCDFSNSTCHLTATG